MISQKKRRGFSLIEVMVVIVILGMIAAIVAVNLGGSVDSARIDKTKIQMKALKDALDLYSLQHNGRYPSRLEELAKETQKGSDKPYLNEIPQDGWGNKFRYSSRGSTFSLISYGANGRRGGTGGDTDLEMTEKGLKKEKK